MTNHLAGGPPAKLILGVKSENAYIMIEPGERGPR